MEDSENITVAKDKEDTQDVHDQDSIEPQETKCTAAVSTGGGANEENKEDEEKTKAKANESEACEQVGGVTENVNTVREKETEVTKKNEEVTEDTVKEPNKEARVNEEGNESNSESLAKVNDINKAEEEGKLEEKNKGDERANDSVGQTKKTEEVTDTKEMKQNKDHVQDKQNNTGRKSATTSALRAPTKSSVCARGARPSARRDAMAKFQKEQTPGVRNFKVQRTSIGMAGGASIKQKILQWCINKTQAYEGVNIENFSSSWSDGLAFCALIHRFFPTAFDFSSLKASEHEKNFTLAFSTAESLADCCPLLEVSDMLLMGKHPDPMCVFTYVQSLCHHLSKIDKERKEKEKKKKEDQEVAHEQGDEEKDESEQHEENQSDSSTKTEKETDQNENVINVNAEV
ncbi:smoothelin-like 1 [Misgurnus anguillicaudatus]|uniref:smoothelin-like 1 n=1 Tax=Misgurnus anguillicaudatus TaxID=75329 RepID=UPI003CCF88FE